jgi:hypothetical protein
MATNHTEQHPNEALGIDVDAPKPGLAEGAVATAEAGSDDGYVPMKCYNLSTGDFVGWLGTYGNNVDLVHSVEEAARLKFSSYGSDLYLRKETDPADRYLGLGWNGYATWGVTGGWNDPIVYNGDHSISLKTDSKRKLYGPYGNDWVCWSGGEDNQNILRIEKDG